MATEAIKALLDYINARDGRTNQKELTRLKGVYEAKLAALEPKAPVYPKRSDYVIK